MTVLYLTVEQVLEIHAESIRRFGGASELLDRGKVESAVAQPAMTFDAQDLYPTIAEKGPPSLTKNHAFQDGNKRVGFGALDIFFRVNGHSLTACDEEIINTFLQLAAGTLTRDDFTTWVTARVQSAAATE